VRFPEWPENTVRAFVTGGTGFLGRRLVEQLLDHGEVVRCLVRPASHTEPLEKAADARPGRLELWRGTLGRVESYAAALKSCDVVYHVAAEMRGTTPVLFLGNVVATRQLLAAVSAAGVGRFVLVSSLAVYGTAHLREGDLLDEDCPVESQPHRRDPYTHSKVGQEAAAWEAQRAGPVKLAVVRPGVIYGPGRDCLSNRLGLRLGSVLLKMGGRQQLPYTYVDNCAAGVLLAGTAPAAAGQAVNLLDDDLPTAAELLRQYRQSVGRVRTLPVPHWAIGPLSRFCEWYHAFSHGQLPAVLTPYKSAAHWKPLRYSNARAKTTLGWQPLVSFAEGLQRTFDCLKEQPSL
jgi:nucleoside-diphosphate-sugar epimerase